MESKLEQESNALAPMLVNDCGNWTVSSCWEPRNALLLMVVVPLGMMTWVASGQSLQCVHSTGGGGDPHRKCAGFGHSNVSWPSVQQSDLPRLSLVCSGMQPELHVVLGKVASVVFGRA